MANASLRKELSKQLKSVFSPESTVSFPSLSPPDSLLDLVEQYVTVSKDASLSRSIAANAKDSTSTSSKADVFIEHQKLVDLLIEISTNLPKTVWKHRRPGRISAWLIVLSRLCTIHSSEDSADESQIWQKEQIAALWPILLRKVLIPSCSEQTHFTMGREGLAACKSLLAWSFKGKADTGNAADLGKFESTLISEYMSLVLRPLNAQKPEDASVKEKEIKDLQDLLCSLGHYRPKTFFAHIAQILPNQPQNRAAVLMMLACFLKKHANLSHHTLPVHLFDQLLLCLLLEQDAHIVQLGLASLLILLPRIPSTLAPYIPLLFTVYAKVVALSHSVARIASSVTITQMPTGSPPSDTSSSPPDSHMATKRTVAKPGLKADVKWTFSDAPSDLEQKPGTLPVREVFTYLYGLLPCNLFDFLRSPVDYLKGKPDFHLPFARDWDEPTIDLKDVGLFSETFLQLHSLQTALISSNSEREITDLKTRWSRFEAAAVIADCEKHYTVHVQQSSTRSSSTHRRTPSGSTAWPMTRQSSYAATHISSRSEERPVVDTDLPMPVANRSSSPDSSHSGQFTPMVNKVHAISLDSASNYLAQSKNPTSLQREIEALRAELNYEQYLKTQHHQHMGILHRQKVMESGFEAERQTLVQFNKHLRHQLTERQSALDKLREETSYSRKAHQKWEGEYKNRLRLLKEEKKTWSTDFESVTAQLTETRAQLTAQSDELEELGAKVFDLEAQIENDKPKIAKLSHYEAWIDKLSQNLVRWDEDLLKYKEQEVRMDALISALRQASLVEESSVREADELKAQLRSSAATVAQLEGQIQALNKKLRASEGEKKLPLSQPTVSYEVLRREYLRARDRCIKLEEEIILSGSRNVK